MRGLTAPCPLLRRAIIMMYNDDYDGGEGGYNTNYSLYTTLFS